MSFRFLRSVQWMVTILLLSGCGASRTTTTTVPAYARSAEHYRGFSGADELGRFLRFDQQNGPFVSAHRGGPIPAYPENALATFERTLRLAPAFLECDVRVSIDGDLILMHDDTLERTTTGEGLVASHSLGELRALLLKDSYGVITPFRIPTLDESLAWAESRAILMLDIKQGVVAGDLIEQIRRHGAEDRVVLIMYSFDQLGEYLALADDLVYSVPGATDEDVDALVRSGLPSAQAIAWLGVGTFDPDVLRRLHDLNVKAMLGTYGETDERAEKAGEAIYLQLLEQGIDVIATDRTRIAVRAVEQFAKFR